MSGAVSSKSFTPRAPSSSGRRRAVGRRTVLSCSDSSPRSLGKSRDATRSLIYMTGTCGDMPVLPRSRSRDAVDDPERCRSYRADAGRCLACRSGYCRTRGSGILVGICRPRERCSSRARAEVRRVSTWPHCGLSVGHGRSVGGTSPTVVIGLCRIFSRHVSDFPRKFRSPRNSAVYP